MTYETLRQMSVQNVVIGAIIQTRTNQVGQFCRPQQGVYDKGYRIILRDRRDDKKRMSSAEQKMAQELEAMIETTGLLLPNERPSDRDSFRQYCKKSVRDVLIYDQLCTELIRDRKRRVSRFVCLPAETIRPAVADIEHLTPEQARERVAYVQVFDNTIISEFGVDDLAWGVMNPRSDLRSNGFGFAPTEMMIQCVTAWLYGFEYNKNFFVNGAAIKGVLNIKGTVPDRQLRAFRRMWYTMVAGAANCLAGSAVIWTKQGAVALGDLLASDKEREVPVWSGTGWVSALAYRTEPKPRCLTRLGSGIVLETSAEHRYRVLDDHGELAWKRQSDLVVGDYVAVNAACVGTRKVPQFGGRALTAQLAEVLGWSIGDGCLAFEGRGHGKRNCLTLYYHHDRELEIRDVHLRALLEFDRYAKAVDKEVTQEEAEHICEKYGFQSCAGVRRSIVVQSVAFVEELVALGFSPSRLGKQIPGCVHAWPAELKAAFLRGFFSADGNNAKRRSPEITIADDRLREQTRLLLLSLGIRTSLSEGRTKTVIDGASRYYIEAKSVLRVKDRDLFFSMIGFLQAHKQPEALANDREANKYDRISPAATIHFCRVIREALKGRPIDEIRTERNYLNAVICGIDGCSRSRLLRFAQFAGVELPSWLTEYHFEPVVDIERTDEVVPMFDLQVYDDEHQFAASGVLVHNSWKTPILNSDDIQWISMHAGNRDMEFGAWMDWLTKLTCACFGMDPLELNFVFNTSGSGGKGAMFSARPNEAEVTESKDRGLVPLMDFLADTINRHIIWDLAPELEFAFSGLDAKSETRERERRKAEVETTKTVNEIREEQDQEPLPDGDIILNAVYLQYVQGKQGQGVPGGAPSEDDPSALGEEEPPEEGEPDDGGSEDEDFGEESDGDLGGSQEEALAASREFVGVVERLRKGYQEIKS